MEERVFDSIEIGLASPEMIRSWSYGEVKKPETINYRTLKAERDGLFCERIFGPTKDWECACGKYKRVRYKGKVCEKCGVEVTTKKVRRERMGHIELACPVSHIWYFRAIPSRMGTLLDISPRMLEKVLYYAEYIVIDPGDTPLSKYQLLSELEYRKYRDTYEDDFRVGMGAGAIKELLAELDIPALSEKLKADLLTASGQKKARIIKRLEVVEAFRKSGNKPEWLILDVLPVIPPDIRSMVQLDGGRFASSDLNDLYRRVINRNNRLKRLMELRSPEIIIRNERRMLQEAVDALIDNGRRGKPITGPSNRPFKSLSEMLRGKQGRFRQNLLGKRVDYSGRSVIVVGPELKIYQCGLPKEMALELFKPFVMKRLVETQKATNIKDAKKKVEKVNPDVWDALEIVIKEHPVLLNRAPTLHRLSIQAFEPVLVEGRAIKLHPLVCTAFNADFDGDQMPVHVPLSAEAQAEARFLMLSANNLLKPADGKAVAVPSQDMVLGSYYLTIDRAGENGDPCIPERDYKEIPKDLSEEAAAAMKAEIDQYNEDRKKRLKHFRDFNEVAMAYEHGVIEMHTPIMVRTSKEIDGVMCTGNVEATYGRLIFNQAIPQDLGYVDRTDPKKQLDLEIHFTCGKKQLGDIVDRTIKIHGPEKTAEVLDAIKSMGYKYSTIASISISVSDVDVPEAKYEIVKQAELDVEQIHKHFLRGELTDEERYATVIAIWEKATKDVVAALQKGFDRYNPIKMMADSGARGNMTQMRQLAGMRGLMFAANGKTMELPVKSNFREGLNILEYFIAARGARKSLSDTALKTADSGYLTRRLVDVSQEVIVREENCGSRRGMIVREIKDGNDVLEKLSDRLLGRYVIGDIVDPKTGEIIAKDDTMLDEAEVKKITAAGIKEVNIRTVLECDCRYGICAHCYGMDLATTKKVNVGEAVGIIAAQSIGEPGTQLTMRNFHTGGVASASDITQGLPRVEEIFEARRPKKTAVIAEQAGVISIADTKRARNVTVTNEATKESTVYPVPYGTHIVVAEGDYVSRGDAITEGHMSLADITRINGLDAAYDYIIKEIQKTYRIQSVEINDKHVEVIARQMTRKCRVEDGGDTNLLVGSLIDVNEFRRENEAIQARIDAGERDLCLAKSSPVLLGITKAALNTESFLSAASFQETTKVLTEAAIAGKKDHLLGLKENVLIGKLIPAGTGMERYRNIDVERVGEDPIAKLEAQRIVQPERNAVSERDEDEVDDEELLDQEDSVEVISEEIRRDIEATLEAELKALD